MRHKFETTSWRPKIIQTVLRRPFRKLLKADNSSLHLMKKKDPRKWIIHVESTRYLDVNQHPEREGGFSEIWRSARFLDVKVCFSSKTLRYWNHDRISVSRQKQFLWVRIVNGINKHVTETSETIAQKTLSTKKWRRNLLRRPFSYSWKKMDRHWPHNHSINVVLQYQKLWSDYCDMVHQFFEKMMEQYDLAILWNNLRQSSMALRNGQLMLGWYTWQGKDSILLETFTLPKYSCISEQFRDNQQIISLILHCKTMYCCRRTSPKYI